MLGCLHRGVVIAPLPPMFNESQLSALIGQTRATGLLTFGGKKELAKCRQVAAQVPFFLSIEPELVDRLAAEDPQDEHAVVPRHADDLAMVLHSSGTSSMPKGIAHSSNGRLLGAGQRRRSGNTSRPIRIALDSSRSTPTARVPIMKRVMPMPMISCSRSAQYSGGPAIAN